MSNKGEQAAVEQPPVEQPEKETPEPEAQKTTLTQEELDALVATATEKGKAEATEEYKGIQRVVSQKETKIKELEAQVTQPSGDDDLAQLLIEERRGKASELGEADPLIPRLEAVISKRKQAQVFAKQQAYYTQAEDINKSAVEAFGEDDVDAIHTIRNYIRAGDFDLAEKKIASVKKPKSKDGEEAKLYTPAQLAEEVRKEMEGKGLLSSDVNLPGGASKRSLTAEQIGAMPYKEWVDAGKPGATK